MQVRTLYRKLGQLIADGEGYKDVVAAKESFSHPLEGDGATILPVESIKIETYPVLSEDGGTTHDDGSEKFKTSLVFRG